MRGFARLVAGVFVLEELVSRFWDVLNKRETGCLVHPCHVRKDRTGGTRVPM